MSGLERAVLYAPIKKTKQYVPDILSNPVVLGVKVGAELLCVQKDPNPDSFRLKVQYIPDVLRNSQLPVAPPPPPPIPSVGGLIIYDAIAVTNTPTAPVVISYGWLPTVEPTRIPKRIRRPDEITIGRIPVPNPPFISTGWFPQHEQRRALLRRIVFDGNIVWGRTPPPLPPAISNGWLTPVEPTRLR